MFTYSLSQWLIIFYIYCFFGWCIESAFVSYKKKHFVNRGFLSLPMLPLYGSGAVLVLFITIPLRKNLLLVYFAGAIAATVLEYFTGAAMEKLFKIRYWDYSHCKYQYQGHICLSSSICWGFLSLLLLEVIHRPIEAFVLRLPSSVALFISLALSALFIVDFWHATRAALDLGAMLERMTRLKTEWEELQVQLEELKLTAKLQMDELSATKDEYLEEIKESVAEQMMLIRERTERQKSHLSDRLKKLSEEHERTAGRLTLAKGKLLKRNPTAASRHFGTALKDIIERNERWYKKD